MAISVYEVVTNRILEAMQAGVVPWRQPWTTSKPRNLVSKKEYRGVNLFLLGIQKYTSPYWCTYKQALEKGGSVRKGESGTPCIFWKIGNYEKDGETKKSFILRYYTVFNVAQCDGLKVPEAEVKEDFNPITECENLVKLYKTIPAIDHGGDRACYIPSFDRICMPKPETFRSPEEYYSTLFHELTHSTGHEDRLNREGVTNPIQFGSHDYSFEELVAECGSAFLCGQTGILNRTLDNSAAYIASWSKKLKSEPKWIVEAASKAAKAADYIQGIKAGAAADSQAA